MTRQQQWALRAHDQVKMLRDAPGRAKFKTFGLKAPNLIRQSGLVQALVFLQSRHGQEGEAFVEALAKVHGAENAAALSDAAKMCSLPEYLALSRDLLEVSTWVRRFVQIEMADIDEAQDV